jgi:hypothetical protein
MRILVIEGVGDTVRDGAETSVLLRLAASGSCYARVLAKPDL